VSLSVTFVDPDGTSRTIATSAGMTLMEVAVMNMIPGVDAECGGACACATCHVLVREDWLARVPDKTEPELGMLDFVIGRRSNSRLSCQIRLSDALDGLTVSVPESQR